MLLTINIIQPDFDNMLAKAKSFMKIKKSSCLIATSNNNLFVMDLVIRLKCRNI